MGPTGHLGRFRLSLASVRALAVMIAGLLSPMVAEATIVVGLHGDDQLIIGTDSKVTAPGSEPRPSLCKIHQGSGCFFALSGPIVGPGFNAIDIARDACTHGDDVDAKMDRFVAQVKQPYQTVHDWLVRNESDFVKSRGPLPLAILMIGRRSGELVMLRTAFSMRSSVAEASVRTEIKNGDASYSLARDLPRFARLNPNWFQPPYARAAERLVEADMASGWVDVGSPVAVLEVDAAGARWFKQGLCPAIDPALWSAK